MKMGTEQFFIDKLHARGFDFTIHHFLRIVKIIILVRITRAAICINQSSLSATSGSSSPLSVVGRSRRYVPHADNGKILDVYAKFHCRRTIKNGEFPFTKFLLTLFTFIFWHLSRMVFCLKVDPSKRYSLIKILEESVWLTLWLF